MRRALIIGAVIAAIAAFFAFGGNDLLTLDTIRARGVDLIAAREAAPFRFAAIFFIVYVAVTALSLPGATIMTLATGAVFGLIEGTILASFASSVGATLAFLASRYVLRDWVRERFGQGFEKIDAGVHRQGGFYLFSIRLVPVFPYFLVNLLFGLTAMRVWTFYWVSQLGMLAGTLVFVNAGTQIALITSPGDILSPGLIGSFLLLALFPWFAKAIMALITRRRLYSRWKKPATFDRNMIVIGAGSAGLVSSLIGATIGAKVTLIEAGKMGGDCLNTGCVPSKALIRSATIAHHIRNGAHYGLTDSAPAIDFRAVMRRIQAVIATIEPHDSVERYTNLGVDVIKGRATIVDPWTVEIVGEDGTPRRLTTRSIIVATGGAPAVPPIPGIETSGYVTSDTIWERFAELDTIPKRIVILGGGPIGCEMAQSFSRLGANVTQIERGERLLSREDADVSSLVKLLFQDAGIDVLTRHEAVRFERDGEQAFLVVEHAGAEKRVAYDSLILALGRTARLTGFGLETLGVETGKTITTNDFLQTSLPNIYAAGDVAGPYQFTHVAGHQAWFSSVNGLFGQFKKFKVDYRVIPWATFIDPEVARVGLNEQEARERNIEHEVTCYPMHELDRAITDGETRGFVKVLTPPGKDRILGVTIVGEHAGELLAEFVLAMKHGIGLKKILGTIHTYPTMAEANRYAAGAWRKANVPERLVGWTRRFFTWQRG